MEQKVEIFFCYARKDQSLLNDLKTYLMPMMRLDLIKMWHDADIGPGIEWEEEINKHLHSAQIILLLVSPDFIASDYCYSIEMTRAMERHKRREVRVIPIILRPVDWIGAPFAKLQALPAGGLPVTSWSRYNEAFLDIARGIRATVEELIKDRTINIYGEPEKYGESAAQGIYELVQSWPEGYDINLAKGEVRVDSTESLLGVWNETQAIVFDKRFKLLRQELWGEQTEQIESELIQEMENAKKAIEKSIIENEDSSPVLVPYNADPHTCDVYLEGGITRVRYKDTTNLGITKNSVRAEIAAGTNMFARMFQHPKAQEAYIQGLLGIHAQSQEQLAKRFVITRAIVTMGPIYLASYAMDPRTNPSEHFMARTQLTSLPKNLPTVYERYQRLSANLTSGKGGGPSKFSL